MSKNSSSESTSQALARTALFKAGILAVCRIQGHLDHQPILQQYRNDPSHVVITLPLCQGHVNFVIEFWHNVFWFLFFSICKLFVSDAGNCNFESRQVIYTGQLSKVQVESNELWKAVLWILLQHGPKTAEQPNHNLEKAYLHEVYVKICQAYCASKWFEHPLPHLQSKNHDHSFLALQLDPRW